jgi:hypothetical protein
VSNDSKFAKPELIELREAWPREDQDFTPWLADNLDYLTDLGFGQLTIIDTEVRVPGVGRQLDILAETIDERRVAIENQYRSLDHDHLTRGLAYAVGLEAEALVLIAEDHQPEFRAVADYLNRASEVVGEFGIPVFLVTLKVERLSDYLIPRFEIVARPNSWRAEVAASSAALGYSSADKARRAARADFWSALLRKTNELDLGIFVNWTESSSVSIFQPAITGRRLLLNVRLRKDEALPTLYIDDGDVVSNEAVFLNLKAKAAEIETQAGFAIEWDDKPGARACELWGRATAECGWATAPDLRNQHLESVLSDFVKLKEALEPVLQQAADDAEQDFGDED